MEKTSSPVLTDKAAKEAAKLEKKAERKRFKSLVQKACKQAAIRQKAGDTPEAITQDLKTANFEDKVIAEALRILPKPIPPIEDGTVAVGLDPSAFRNCGWACVKFTDKKMVLLEKFTQVVEDVEEFKNDPWNNLARFRQTYDILANMIKKHNVKILCLERSMGTGLTFVRGNLNETVGIAKLCCFDHGVKIYETSPAHLKKIVTGTGKATKTQIKKSIVTAFDLKSAGPEHECDAAAMVISYAVDAGWKHYKVKGQC